jgi:hypothetical protein
VHHRDLVPLYVEQLQSALGPDHRVESALGDARHVDLGDASVNAVLLLGPLYHLPERSSESGRCRKAAASSARTGRLPSQ